MADPPPIIRFFNMVTLPQLKEKERLEEKGLDVIIAPPYADQIETIPDPNEPADDSE